MPNDEKWIADFLGAILPLAYAENWELTESLTPTEMAGEWLSVFLSFAEGRQLAIPAGVIVDYGGATAPDGWLFCDGTTLYRSAYAALFAAIGTNYGAGNGTTTFTIPNFPHRVSVGRDPSIPEFDSLGEVGGSISHTLTVGEIPVHTHVQDSHNHTQNSHNHTQNAHLHAVGVPNNVVAGSASTYSAMPYQGWNSVVQTSPKYNSDSTTPTNQASTATNQASTATNQNAGTGGSHNNMPPYLVVNKIIKY